MKFPLLFHVFFPFLIFSLFFLYTISVCLSVYWSVSGSVCMFISLSLIHALSICLSIYQLLNGTRPGSVSHSLSVIHEIDCMVPSVFATLMALQVTCSGLSFLRQCYALRWPFPINVRGHGCTRVH